MTEYFYAASTGGFYIQGLHPTIPADAVAVSDATHAALMTAQAQGQVIAFVNGQPVAQVPAVTAAQAVAALGAMLTAKESAGIYFTPTGTSSPILFPSDAAAQAKYTAAWNALTASPALAADGDIYIAADGTPVALSMTDARALVQKALAYVRACFAHYGTLHADVAANPAADITAGWPANT